jgi:hypothetical protein
MVGANARLKGFLHYQMFPGFCERRLQQGVQKENMPL